MEFENILDRIAAGRDKLNKAGEFLKGKFVGLDGIIDAVLANMQAWYVMPELIRRPVIINLWGMTGVGKTDLVRNVVRQIGFSDRFLEIQLSTSGDAMSAHGGKSISDRMANSTLEPGKPGILLLDEIQRFRTIDDEGKEIPDCKFQDVWMLLSDGKFGGKFDVDELMRIIFDGFFYSVPEKEDEDKKKSNKHDFQIPYYSAKRLKRVLKRSEPVEEIMKWSEQRMVETASAKMRATEIYEGDDYSQVLVFVSGNLDEAYKMSGDVTESEYDADVMHAHSAKVDVIKIKAALGRRFKPEQISRLGNTHVIYPSLSRSSYEKIITAQLAGAAAAAKQASSVDVEVDPSVNEFVYRNGVFPAQGTRPVFSTLASCIEAPLPTLLMSAIENKQIHISLSWADDHLVASVAGKPLCKVPCKGMIDCIKERSKQDIKVGVAVHEVGHAIVYSVLFGLAPTQIATNAASFSSHGFIGTHGMSHVFKSMRDLIAVFAAGSVAEEIVFGGGDYNGPGQGGDVEAATHQAAIAVKNYGLAGILSKNRSGSYADAPGTGNSMSNYNDTQDVKSRIEGMLRDGRATAKEILMRDASIALMKEASADLVRDGKMSPDGWSKMAAKYGVEAKVVDPQETQYADYAAKYEEFFGMKFTPGPAAV